MAQGVYHVLALFSRTSKAQGILTTREFGSLGLACNLSQADIICRQEILLHMQI